MSSPNLQEAQNTFSREQVSALDSTVKSSLTVTADSASTSSLTSAIGSNTTVDTTQHSYSTSGLLSAATRISTLSSKLTSGGW